MEKQTKQTRKIIDLPPAVITKLGKMAVKERMKVKPFMEKKLIELSEAKQS